MMEFFRILFFAKTVLLTPEPIDLVGDVELELKEPLVAITRGASIEIDVSSILTKRKQESIIEFDRKVAEIFPVGGIEANLFSEDEVKVILSYDGGAAYTNDRVFLMLYADGGVPTDVEFDRLMIRSRIKLTSVTVSWRNSKH